MQAAVQSTMQYFQYLRFWIQAGVILLFINTILLTYIAAKNR